MIPPEQLMLPPLREDLKLNPGIKSKEGFPTWTIYDPTNNKYFRIGWKEFEMISRWHLKNPALLVKTVNTETTLTVTMEDIKHAVDFLVANNLIHHPEDKAGELLYTKNAMAKPSRLRSLATNYLFFRIPLFRPDRFLNATSHWLKYFFNIKAIYLLLGLMFVSLYLVSRQWEQFVHTFMYFFTWEGMIYYAIALSFIQILHELGHAYAANHYGCRVHSIGIAFIVLWPVLYTDTTDSWRLTSRKQQIVINGAGVVIELFLASLALLLWIILDDGIFRSMCFITATVSLIATLSVNLNPLMRFDGYYLLADIWDIDNLQNCSFSLGKWRIRQWLFKLKEQVPFVFSKKNQFWLIVYAYATWVYRFLLYLSIALLVYHLFFKALGIILMLVEIVMLICLPIWKELKVYYEMREQIQFKKINYLAILLFTSMLALTIIPWNNNLYVPALLRYGNESIIYTPQAAIVQHIYVKEGEQVSKGDVLVQLYSPKLEMELKAVELDIQKTQHIIRQDLQLLRERGDEIAAQEELLSQQSKYSALVDKKSRLAIRSPFSGKIVELNDSLRSNSWIAKDSFLIEVVDQSTIFIEAYVDEDNIAYVDTTANAKFTSSDLILSLDSQVATVDNINVKVITEPYLGSNFGGELPILVNEENQFIPATAIYKILLNPKDQAKAAEFKLNKISIGTVKLKESPRSLLKRIWQAASYILIRESGF